MGSVEPTEIAVARSIGSLKQKAKVLRDFTPKSESVPASGIKRSTKPSKEEPADPEFGTGSRQAAYYETGVRRAIEVIGSESEAMRWMGTPVRALNYATPISLLYDAAGLEAVDTTLGRLEHGIS